MAVYSRRDLLRGPLLACPAILSMRAQAGDRAEESRRRLGDLERKHGGRLGVAILDTAGTQPVVHRGDERFPLCSTHKLLTAAFVLARVDARQESLARHIIYALEDLVPYSPVTEKRVGGNGLTVGDLCEAAITLSDNTAANLLLDSFGGPAGLTAYVRSLGDPVTRLDRREPALNAAMPGDPRDTTSPLAMLGLLRQTVLGTALSAASRAQLAAWLVACTTGDKRLRAGVPKSWRIGDKTGSGAHNTANDVAIVWPPGRAPIIVTAYYTGAKASNEERDLVLADVGRIAAMM
jgi:beta-lactamase class A